MSSRPALVALGALLLVVALAPLVPSGDGDDGAVTPSGSGAARLPATVGYNRMTPALRAEVDRVVADGRRLGRELARVPASTARSYVARQVATFVRCADLDGEHYCLGTGWTDDTEAEVQARTLAAVGAQRHDRGRPTGDLDARAALRAQAAMPVAVRARAERAELTMAARSVAKVKLLRDGGGIVPIVPPTTSTPTPTASPTTTTGNATYDSYPESAAILDTAHVAEQERNYYCGPTAMQMIAWGWHDKYRSQDSWAKKLGTTGSGTSITSMVAVTNRRTGWDTVAGPYLAIDVKHYSFDSWQLLVMKHIVDLQAPMILHVQLLKTYFPYLDHDGSGHFQVGRGYDKRGDKPDLVGYFEPWNQQRFHPDEPFISRVQWRQSYRTFRATLAHYQHNVGV